MATSARKEIEGADVGNRSPSVSFSRSNWSVVIGLCSGMADFYGSSLKPCWGTTCSARCVTMCTHLSVWQLVLTVLVECFAESWRQSLNSYYFIFPFLFTKQGHHHNGDQAARRPNMMCSICGRRFGCNFKGRLFDPPVWGVRGTWGWEMGPFDSPPMSSY